MFQMAISIVSTHWKHDEGKSIRYIAFFFKFTLPCDGERDFFELEVEVV